MAEHRCLRGPTSMRSRQMPRASRRPDGGPTGPASRLALELQHSHFDATTTVIGELTSSFCCGMMRAVIR